MRTPAPDAEDVQRRSHHVEPRLFARDPEGGTWIPMITKEATVTLADEGFSRSLTASIMIEYEDGESLLNNDFWSVFGTWVRAEQWVYRVDGSYFVVPWGFFRVNTYSVDVFTGMIVFTAGDAFSQLQDHNLQSLRDHNLAKSDIVRSRLSATISAAFAGIPRFWTTLVDMGSFAADNRKPSAIYLHPNDDRAEFCRLMANRFSNAKLVCPASGALFAVRVLRNPEASEETADFAITDGLFGNLVDDDFHDQTDRQEMFNTVTVTYTKITPITGARTRTEQRRMIVNYDDAGEPLRTSGPFGKVSATSVTLDVTTDADALSKGVAAIQQSLKLTRDISMQCSPVYGIEPGDTFYVRTPTTIGMSGRLVGATIPLHADGGPWTLNMKNYKALDQSWRPKYSIVSDGTSTADNADWKPFAPRSRVALDNGFPTGWTITGGKSQKVRNGVTLQVISNGGTVTMRTGQAWLDVGEHRFRARAATGLNNRTAWVSVGILYMPQNRIVWSKEVKVLAHHSKVVSVDATIPAAARSFGVYVRFRNTSDNSDFRLYNIAVERAVRSKT